MTEPAEAAVDARPGRVRRRPVVALVVGGVVLIVAAAAVVWYMVGSRSESAPEQTARRFVDALHRGDCPVVLDALSADTYQHFEDVSEVIRTFDFRTEACAAVAAAKKRARVTTVDTVLSGGDGAIVRVTSTFGSGRVTVHRDSDVYLVKEGEGWKVDLTLDVAGSGSLLPEGSPARVGAIAGLGQAEPAG